MTLRNKRRGAVIAAALVGAVALAGCAGRGGESTEAVPGVTDETILIGTSLPQSGSAAVFGLYAEGVRAYFNYINDNGGVHGRSIEYKVLDDGYEPARTLQNVKQLVESDGVFAIAFVVGTAHSMGIREYLNEAGVPNVLANTGHADFGDPAVVAQYPWTTAWLPEYKLEAQTAVQYLSDHKPDAKVAILYQNDDLGNALVDGFESAIQGTGIEVVAKQVYNNTDASVAGPTQILAQSGADVFMNWSSGTFTAQTITTMTDLDWKPTTFLISWNTALSTLEPAGLQNSAGFLAPGYLKEPYDPSWADDAGVQQYFEIMAEYGEGADATHHNVAYGFTEAEILVRALQNAPELTRQGLMDSLNNMDNEEMLMLVPGTTVTTDAAAGDYWPLSQLGLLQFDGSAWKDSGWSPEAAG